MSTTKKSQKELPKKSQRTLEKIADKALEKRLGPDPNKKPRPKTGPGGVENFPCARKIPDTDENREIIKQLLVETLAAYTKPKVHSDEELAERLDEYFYGCASTGQVPTVEEMALYVGYEISYINDIETGRRRGFGPDSAEIFKKAKAFLKTYDAKSVVAGKQNPIVYFFRAKNYYGMVDKKEMVLTPNNTNLDISSDELRQKYLEDSAADFTTDGVAEDQI